MCVDDGKNWGIVVAPYISPELSPFLGHTEVILRSKLHKTAKSSNVVIADKEQVAAEAIDAIENLDELIARCDPDEPSHIECISVAGSAWLSSATLFEGRQQSLIDEMLGTPKEQ